MPVQPQWLRPYQGGALLFLKVSTGASANALGGIFVDEADQHWVKLKITAAPEKGKANKAVIAYLSKTLSLPKTSISIIAGEKDRSKRLVLAASYETLQVQLASLLR